MTYYDHNPGIHFENLGQLQIFNNKCKLITFVDLDNLSDKVMSLSNYYKVTIELCDHNNAQYHYYICNLFLSSSKYTFEKIKTELNVLHELVGHNIVNKIKRGWFNIIGKATKVLFGTLDADDARYYDSKISEFTKDETSALNLLKEQSKIVQSTLLNFNNTIGTLDFNENLLKSISQQLNKEQKDVQFLTLKSNLEHVTLLNIACSINYNLKL